MRPISASRTARAACALVACVVLASLAWAAPGTKTITFQDLMKFRAIERPVISDDGTVVAYGLQPDRGDGEGIVQVVQTGKTVRVPRGGQPVISKNGRFVAMAVKVAFADSEKAGKDKPKPGMALVNVATGQAQAFENVDRFAFSDDSRWLAYLLPPAEAAKKTTDKPSDEEDADVDQESGSAAAAQGRKPGGTLKLRNLESGDEQTVAFVAAFAFDSASKYLAYSVADETGKGNGLFCRDLAASAPPVAITQAQNGHYEPLAWSKAGSVLAFVSATDSAKGQPGPGTVWLWDGVSKQAKQIVKPEQAPKGYSLPFKNEIVWAKDGKRIFFGFKAGDAAADATQAKKAAADPYDFDQILSKVELDVWHWNDAKINSEQKKAWDREKDRTYRAVYHVDTSRVVQLAARDLPSVDVPENDRVALATSDVPYMKETTWGEGARDVYLVDLANGSRKPVVTRLTSRPSMSPDGKTIAYFKDGQWQLYDCVKGTTRAATASLKVGLTDEEHDTPDEAPAYGIGGWVDDGASLLVYDRYDIWQIPVAGGAPVALTNGEGRAKSITFRVVQVDPDARSYRSRDALLLTAYHEHEKNWGFYAARPGKPGVEARVDEKKLFKFVGKAKAADVVMYTRESYDEFPNVWASDLSFREPRRMSDANPQMAEFAWGSAELVEWRSVDGIPLQGVLIKPANYQPGKRYPVITYFYERQSQRLYEFNEPVVNHRPSFAIYTGAGYAIFLPDVVFEVGRPGYSMVKCLVPGVQKLVDMGIADPNALGLHGHSWGGYGTAFVVTQTNIFKAAVAGAAVSNMTSAYGGIRWESGVARQFQYEKTQSRIGGSLWEYPERFIENSALFAADHINTPLLLEHGDDDGAVPWYQSIELYLAMRRLGKDCIFLQYRGEPHHLRKYPNKLDYAIKMKQYFDHYLKGEPAADWITKGVAYAGK